MRIKRWIAWVLSLALLLAYIPTKSANASQFADIDNHWAKDDIERAVDEGLFVGVQPTKFAPDVAMTRAMFVTVIAKQSGYRPEDYKTTKFSDVKTKDWYAPAVAWAVQNRIVSGTSKTTFSPNKSITREQVAVMMVNYANYSNIVLPRVRKAKQFEDINQCADFALDAILTLYRSGIVEGMKQNRFAPKGTVTRAQGAVMLCNYMDISTHVYQDNEKVILVAHRGYSKIAPENTLCSYQLAAEKGYTYVETDVQFTKDNIPVLIHDDKIDRVSNGSGNVKDLTYQQLKQYDFGSWKSEEYTGTKIATFEEFIKLCAQYHLRPYIELKGKMTATQITDLLDTVAQYGMQNQVAWISFEYSDLLEIKKQSPYAELMLLAYNARDGYIQKANALKNGKNRITLSVSAKYLTPENRARCLRNHLHIGMWTVNDYRYSVEMANTSADFITTDVMTYDALYR